MKEVIIDGVLYKKAAEVAKDFRYTTDYIGQLCRSGKVDAKLIGRSWFVNPESITTHKQGRYKNTPIPDQTTASEITSENIPTSDDGQKAESGAKQFLRKITWNAISYETDESELLPELKKPGQENQKVKLRIEPAEASGVKVRSEAKKPTALAPTALPEVSLNGTLKVASLDTYYDIDEDEEADIALAPSVGTAKKQPTSLSRSQLKNTDGAVTMRRIETPQKLRSAPIQPKSKILLKRYNKQNKGFLEKLSELDKKMAEQKAGEKVGAGKPPVAAKTVPVFLKSKKESERVPKPSLKKASTESPIIPKKATPQPVVSETSTTPSFLVVHLSVLLAAAVLLLLFGVDSKVMSTDYASITTLGFNFANIWSIFSF